MCEYESRIFTTGERRWGYDGYDHRRYDQIKGFARSTVIPTLASAVSPSPRRQKRSRLLRNRYVSAEAASSFDESTYRRFYIMVLRQWSCLGDCS